MTKYNIVGTSTTKRPRPVMGKHGNTSERSQGRDNFVAIIVENLIRKLLKTVVVFEKLLSSKGFAKDRGFWITGD